MSSFCEQIDVAASCNAADGVKSAVKGVNGSAAADDEGCNNEALDDDWDDGRIQEVEADDFKYTYPPDRPGETTVLHGQYQRRSPVWKYFVDRHTSAVCRICRRSVKRQAGNTTNLRNHLRCSHRAQYIMLLRSIRVNEERRREVRWHHFSHSGAFCTGVCLSVAFYIIHF